MAIPKNKINLSSAAIRKAYVAGGIDVAKMFGRLAGKQLQAGNGELMAIFNRVMNALTKMIKK